MAVRIQIESCPCYEMKTTVLYIRVTTLGKKALQDTKSGRQLDLRFSLTSSTTEIQQATTKKKKNELKANEKK